MNIEVIPLSEGVSNATLTAYIQDPSMDNRFPIIRPAIVICPGGAYLGITEKETEPVAMRFLSAGYQVFVLKYSIGAGIARFPAPFIDAAKAILLVRQSSKKWYVDSDRISLCGFSTGGQVAAILAATWQEDYLEKALKVDSQLYKPNALILGYPLLELFSFKIKNMERPQMQSLLEMMFTSILGTLNPSKEQLEEWDCRRRVTSHMPPTFLWTTAEDTLVDVEESMDFIKVLIRHKIPYEVHIFEKGAHGLSLGDQTVGYSDNEVKNHVNAHVWVDLALRWLLARIN